ncbi:odorant receptor 94a-like [Haematobia irritans]|uniref:odorant receptor 94a-like n=1 Tax=Haematobia irritans TaxID=7368 RepID=UPI003F507C9D
MSGHLHLSQAGETACERIYAAEILLKIMKVIGLWQWSPSNGQLDSNMVKCGQLWQYIQRFVLHMPFTFIFIGLMWIEVLRASDIDQMGDVLYMSLTEAALIVKILNIWQHSVKASNFICILNESPQFALHSLEEVEYWKRAQRQFRYVIYMYASGSFLTVVSAFLGVLVIDEPQMAFAYWVPFEWRSGGRNYWMAYFYNFAAMACTATSNVCLDMMGCYFLFHTSLLYKILSFRLQKFKGVKSEDVQHEFRSIFQMHKAIRRMTKECEILTSKYVLAQIILSALILCFCCYRIQKMDIAENIGQFFSMLQFLCVMILEIFLPCYFGNEITVNSSQLTMDLYHIEWLNFSISNRKLMVLFKEFLKRPDQVKIGGYFQVGLPIFTKVINNAYSVFALLMNVERNANAWTKLENMRDGNNTLHGILK